MAATKKKKKKRTKKQQQAFNAGVSAALFGVFVFICALIFIKGTNYWPVLRGWGFGLFGASLYLVAPLVLYLAFCASQGKDMRTKSIQAAVLLLLASALWHAIASEIPPAGMGFFDGIKMFYDYGAVHTGGGVFAALLAWPLLLLFGRAAAIATLLVFLVVAGMLLTGLTPQDFTDFMKNRAGDAKEAFTPPPREAHAPAAKTQTKKQAAAKAPAHASSKIDIDIGNDPLPISDEDAPPIDPFPIIPSGPVVPSDAAAVAPVRTQAQSEHLEQLIKAATTAMAENISAEEERLYNHTVPAPVISGEEPQEGAAASSAAENTLSVKNIQIDENGKQVRPPYVHPPITVFDKPSNASARGVEAELKRNADLLVKTLASFGVQTTILDISRGPAVTRYELQPAAGVKISRITGLADDIALALASTSVRIEAPIPNKSAVGIEVPNKSSASVRIRSVLESEQYKNMESPITLPLGKDIAGEVQVADLSRMPHLLVAGSTGSGKSVCINAIITSILYKASPDDVKMILIDPKMVELSEYNGVPHLLMPVVTNPREAASALAQAVNMMEMRYRLFADNNVREIKSYNALADHEEDLEKMPYIAIIVDELADLMMAAGKEVEDYICRLAQKARAAGMHLVVATQRPSVDVITGLIKANIPSRIAFAVSSQVDSRTILDSGGAEKLLGMGDMLFLPVGASKPLRVQGTYVTDEEIAKVIKAAKRGGEADYNEELIAEVKKHADGGAANGSANAKADAQDEMFIKAVELVVDVGQASTSLLQRKLKLGYARAARIMDEMEEKGIIGPYEGSKPRQVLLTRAQFIEMSMNTAAAQEV